MRKYIKRMFVIVFNPYIKLETRVCKRRHLKIKSKNEYTVSTKLQKMRLTDKELILPGCPGGGTLKSGGTNPGAEGGPADIFYIIINYVCRSTAKIITALMN